MNTFVSDRAIDEASELIIEALRILMQAGAPTYITDDILDVLRGISDLAADDVVESDRALGS